MKGPGGLRELGKPRVRGPKGCIWELGHRRIWEARVRAPLYSGAGLAPKDRQITGTHAWGLACTKGATRGM